MSPDEESIVSRESKRQAVILGFTLVGTVATMWIVYSWTPDNLRTMKMWLALRAKRIAQQQVDWWQDIADRAATQYNKEKW